MGKYFALPVTLQLLGWIVIVKGQTLFNSRGRNDLVLTYKQKITLDQFKQRMENRLPHEYMKEETYLVRWLRLKQFNVKNADDALMENLQWRKENKMDEIQQEDFSDVHEEHPLYVDTVGKNGQPVFTAVAGEWNLRQGFLTGTYKREIRYIYKMLDKAAILVREAQQAGKNVTRFDIILSLEGFNLVLHGCPRCLISIANFIGLSEKYYPELYDRVTIINAPDYVVGIFEPLIRAAITQTSIDSINFKLFGTNRNVWRRYFLQFIDEKELPEEMGGLRVRH